MKYLLVSLALFSMSALAETVIRFDDGSTYTLEDNQVIYISNENSTLFKRRIMKNIP